MIRCIIAGIILAICTYIGGATAGTGGVTPSEADLRQGITTTRGQVQNLRDQHCRDRYPYRPTRTIPSSDLKASLATWQNRKQRERAASSACSNVRQIIRQVFGPTAGAALRVAECESHLWPLAVGAAGERGVWQIHPIHFGSLDEDRLWDPLYSTRLAYRWSDRGTNFSPTWTCATNLGIP